MPDFTAKITNGATLADWEDPEAGGNPARTNPDPLYAHRHFTVPLGATITIKATVGDVEGPLDATLSGATFYRKWAEWPTQGSTPPPAVLSSAGLSSVMTCKPKAKGHYLLMIRRKEAGDKGGGGVGIPFDVVDPVLPS